MYVSPLLAFIIGLVIFLLTGSLLWAIVIALLLLAIGHGGYTYYNRGPRDRGW